MAPLQREFSLGKISCPWRDQREIFINHPHNKYWIRPERSKPFRWTPSPEMCKHTSKSACWPTRASLEPHLWPTYISHTQHSDLLIPTCSLWDCELLLAGRSNVNIWYLSDKTTSSSLFLHHAASAFSCFLLLLLSDPFDLTVTVCLMWVLLKGPVTHWIQGDLCQKWNIILTTIISV